MKSHLLAAAAGALVGVGGTSAVFLAKSKADVPRPPVIAEAIPSPRPTAIPLAAMTPAAVAAPAAGATSPVPPPPKQIFDFKNSPQVQALQRSQAEQRLDTLIDFLELQPHQLNALRLLQESQRSKDGRSVNTHGPAFKALLTPDQLAKLDAFEAKERRNIAESAASMELSQIDRMFDLTEEQKDAIFNQLAALQLEAFDPKKATALAAGETDSARVVKLLMNRKRDALDNILSPEQMKAYSAQLDMMEKLTVEMMPEMPATESAP